MLEQQDWPFTFVNRLKMDKQFLVKLAQYVFAEGFFDHDFDFIFTHSREEIVNALDYGDDASRNKAASQLLMNVLGYPHGRIKDIEDHFQITRGELESIYETLLDLTGYYLEAAGGCFADMIIHLISGEIFGDLSSIEFVSNFEYDKATYIRVYHDLKSEDYGKIERMCNCVRHLCHYYVKNFGSAEAEIKKYIGDKRSIHKHYHAWHDYYCPSIQAVRQNVL